ncbi:carbon-nitrogen hydrolase family protein [Legionella impletisoli]|uniref:Nitrilase n=1 Tax=Legionella impletisoli TaxID=343510 RepID=A0A917JZS0_9GAMM|nr:carbon-nitrogen hydrolase family protein [Legionella impletisoli]GGI91695.1 nitrilase [Legionella impletisoli]
MSHVAVIQMVSSSDVDKNLKELGGLFANAHELGAELLVLPENFAFMGLKERDKFAVAEDYGQGVIQNTISELASQYGIWVVAGTIPLKSDTNRLKSACLVYDAEGTVAARYDKIHLFDVQVSEQESHKESTTIEPGEQAVVVDTPVGKIGLSVCYDLRFPELFQLLLNKGAQIFAVPSAFTAVTGKAHWEVLLRARAIENLSYVLAANQGGLHDNGRKTYGHSMIVEPWGEVIGIHEQGQGMVVSKIDLERMHQLRKQFPCNDHHKLKR